MAQSQSPGTMMGNKALLILQVTFGLVCSHYYVSTEKYEDLNTGEAITEVEGFGPSGPPDQTDQSRQAPVPIEVRTYFNLLSEIQALSKGWGSLTWSEITLLRGFLQGHIGIKFVELEIYCKRVYYDFATVDYGSF